MPFFRSVSLAALSAFLVVPAAIAAPVATGGQLKGGVFEQPVSASITNLPLRDAIRLMAQKGRLNLAIEDNLTQTVNVDFRGVRLGDALETLFSIGGVQAVWQGNIFTVVSRQRALERGLLGANGRMFQLHYGNAARIAEFLNASGGIQGGGAGGDKGGEEFKMARADVRSNSIMVMGTASDIALAAKAIAALDQPLQQRVFKLSHANAVQVASLLNATLFATGQRSESPDQVRVDLENIQEGSGGNNISGGIEAGNASATVRNFNVQTQTMPIDARYAVAVPDSRNNAVIVMGSQAIFTMAEDAIRQLDRAPRQVQIAVQIIEVNATDSSNLGVILGGQKNSISTAFDPNSSNGWAISYDPSTYSTGVFRARINALLETRKARVLANPTILATDNTESQINIVDEVVKGVRVSNQGQTSGGQSLIVTEPVFGIAGVTLNILPKIGTDDTVTLRLHPTVSAIRDTQRDALNNPISLLSRRELVAQQVLLRSGHSLVIGGLTKTDEITSVNKLPLLGDIPFIGVLFRSTNTEKRDTELVITVTPLIVPEESLQKP